MFDFNEKVVVVTGASGIGIGKTIAKRFFEAGSSLAICSIDKEGIQEAACEIDSKNSGKILAMYTDTGKVESLQDFTTAVMEKYGRIDVWVNNAGTIVRKPSLEMTEADWDRVIDVDLKGYYFGCQCAARVMKEQSTGGSIINIGSVAKTRVSVLDTVYSIAKTGVSKMTEQVAREWGPYAIRVNCIAPGSIPTAINREAYADPKVNQEICDMIPLKRRGTTEDIASAVLFMASPYASYIAGQTLLVDGGLSLVTI